jgi:pentatricopeptide repeat protein
MKRLQPLNVLALISTCVAFSSSVANNNERRPRRWHSTLQEEESRRSVVTTTCLFSFSEHLQNIELPGDEKHSQKTKFSKLRWKKKRFLMMQDVKQRIRDGDPHAPRKAREMVRRMLTLYEKNGDKEYKPNVEVYNLWIHSLAKSRLPNAGEMAEQVLNEIKSTGLKPNIMTYTSVMDAYGKSKSPEKAEKILFELLSDDGGGSDDGVTAVTCDTLLNAWAQSGTQEGAERAQDILRRLEMWQQKEIRPTQISYATGMFLPYARIYSFAWREQFISSSFFPFFIHSKVITAWAKVGTREAALKAEAVLFRMLRPSPSGSSDDSIVRPDTSVFNAAINAWSLSGDSEGGTKALVLFRKMKELAETEGYNTRPDIVTYNTLLAAWSNCGHASAAQQTEKIVAEMKKQEGQSKDAPSPNTISYNTILNAWSKSDLPGAAQRAQKVLEFMLKSNNEDIRPDIYSFTSVINAYAKSKEANKSVHARELLNRLLFLYETTKRPELRPTPHPYNTVLNACAFSASDTTMEEQREALQIAVSTFTDMSKAGIPPDNITYGNLLKCFANLMPQGQARTDMALQIFDKCVTEGLVGNLAWNEARKSIPSGMLMKKYRLKRQPGSLKVRDLPRGWRRQTKKDRKRQRSDESTAQSHVASEVHNNITADARGRHTIIERSFESGKDL